MGTEPGLPPDLSPTPSIPTPPPDPNPANRMPGTEVGRGLMWGVGRGAGNRNPSSSLGSSHEGGVAPGAGQPGR